MDESFTTQLLCNPQAAQGRTAMMDTEDWRVQLPKEGRERIVNRILDVLKRYMQRRLPFYELKILRELHNIATGFEQKIYATATSKYDYLRKISVKLINWEDSNSQPTQGGDKLMMDTGDWRVKIQNAGRQRIVNEIMEEVKRHLMRYLPVFGEVGLLELKKIVIRFEEQIYTNATSRYEYLRKISVKLLNLPAICKPRKCRLIEGDDDFVREMRIPK